MEYTKEQMLPYDEWCYKYTYDNVESQFIIKRRKDTDWDAKTIVRINNIKYFRDSWISKELMNDNPEFVIEYSTKGLIEDVNSGRIQTT